MENNDADTIIQRLEGMEKDAMIMALRLLGENPDTFSPECYEVMKRWRPKALKYLLLA